MKEPERQHHRKRLRGYVCPESEGEPEDTQGKPGTTFPMDIYKALLTGIVKDLDLKKGLDLKDLLNTPMDEIPLRDIFHTGWTIK